MLVHFGEVFLILVGTIQVLRPFSRALFCCTQNCLVTVLYTFIIRSAYVHYSSRFSPEEKAKRDPMLYMPFGAGPRQCIATRLALLEVKIAITHALKTHRFAKAPETQVPIKFAIQSGLLKVENGV